MAVLLRVDGQGSAAAVVFELEAASAVLLSDVGDLAAASADLKRNFKNTRACAFWTFSFVHPETTVIRCAPSYRRQNRPAA